MKLGELLGAFQKELYLPDTAPIEVAIATYVANLLPGDPVWTMLVGPPSSGKTEILNTLSDLPHIYAVSTITIAGLLSGSTSKDENATGGLLAEIAACEGSSPGVIICKDFTSILSEGPDSCRAVLAALREVFDGSYVRHFGNLGGRKILWDGKVGVLAAVTEIIDNFGEAMGTMGQRFLFFRMPALTDEGRQHQAYRALANAGRQNTMRRTLVKDVATYVAGLTIPNKVIPLSDTDQERLVNLADLATRCRSSVERQGYNREIAWVPEPEAPARFQAQLVQLRRAFQIMGVGDQRAFALLTSLALDAMAKDRRAIVEFLVTESPNVRRDTSSIGDEIGLPFGTTMRALEDLWTHGILDRHGFGTTTWQASDWLRGRWKIAQEANEALNVTGHS